MHAQGFLESIYEKTGNFLLKKYKIIISSIQTFVIPLYDLAGGITG